MENEEEKKAKPPEGVPPQPAQEKDERPWMAAEPEARGEITQTPEEMGMAEAMAMYDTDKTESPPRGGGGGGGERGRRGRGGRPEPRGRDRSGGRSDRGDRGRERSHSF